MADSPTSRTLKKLRAEGWMAAVVEHWNPHARIRQDLLGFIDVLAVRGVETLAVQATTGANHAARRTKMMSEKLALKVREWLKGGTRRLEIWSWTKQGARGKRKTWQCRRQGIGIRGLVDDMDAPVKITAEDREVLYHYIYKEDGVAGEGCRE